MEPTVNQIECKRSDQPAIVSVFSAPPLLLMEYLVSRMTKTQGTTTRLHCSATNDPDDTSLDISWYKDGKKITPFGRIKVRFIVSIFWRIP